MMVQKVIVGLVVMLLANCLSASEICQEAPALVNLDSDLDAKHFRTRLTEGAKSGPNFAGCYTIVSWGCGTNCQTGAVISVRSGDVLDWFVSCGAQSYRLESDVLILNPHEEGVTYSPGCEEEHYIWSGEKLMKSDENQTERESTPAPEGTVW